MERVEMPAQLQPAKARKPRAKQVVIPAVERAIKAARVARQVIALLERNGMSWYDCAGVVCEHFAPKLYAKFDAVPQQAAADALAR